MTLLIRQRHVADIMLDHLVGDINGRGVGRRTDRVLEGHIRDTRRNALDVFRGAAPEGRQSKGCFGIDLPASCRNIDAGFVHVQKICIPECAADAVGIRFFVPDNVDTAHFHLSRILFCSSL